MSGLLAYDPNNHGPTGDPLASLYQKYPSFQDYLDSEERKSLPLQNDAAMEYRYQTSGKGAAPTGGWKNEFTDKGIVKAGTGKINQDYLLPQTAPVTGLLQNNSSATTTPVTSTGNAATRPTLSDVVPAGSSAITPTRGATAPTTPASEATTLPGSTLTTAPSDYIAPTYTPGESATVEGRLKGLLSSGSPYVEAARQRAVEAANARGLLNSSMAATAGEKAAIESSLPIATADAQTMANAGLTGYQGEITAAQSAQQAGQTQELAKLQAGLTSEVGSAQAKLDAALKSGLSAQEAMQTTLLTTHQAALQSGLNEQDALAKSALATLQAGFAAGLSTQESKQRVYEAAQVALAQAGLSKQEQDAAMVRLKTELESKGGLLDQQLQADKEIAAMQQEGADRRAEAENALKSAQLDKETYADAQQKLAAFSESYTNQIYAVQQDPTYSADTKTMIMNQLRTQYIFNMDMVGQLYGIDIEWSVPEIPT